MKKYYSLFVLLLLSISSFAQKENGKIQYDKKTDIVSDASGNFLFKMVAKRNAATSLMEYSIKDKDDKELFFISATEFSDPGGPDADPTGRVVYLVYNFFDLKLSAETRYFGSNKNLAQYIFDSGVMKNGLLDADGVKRYVQITGTKFSDRKKVIDQPKQNVIIEQNNPPSNSNKGVNINVNVPPHN